MPGRKWYLVSVLIAAVGVVAASAFLLLRLGSMSGAIQQVVVPGTAELRLDEPGGYTIFHETGATVDGRYYAATEVSGISVEIESEGGEAVVVRPATVSTSYEIGGRSGRAIFAFDVERPGLYRMTGSYADGSAEPAVVLGVAYAFGRGIAVSIAGVLAIAFGSFGLGIALAAWTFLRRRRATRSAAAPPPGPALTG